MTSLQIFQILRARIGERESEALLTYVDTTLEDNRNELLDALEPRFASIDQRFASIDQRFVSFEERFATKEDLANVKGELSVKISDVRSDVIRWMFAFFLAMLIAILGLYFKK